ncbi:MAG TPA: mechanosensitive ion channel family protein [Jiangellales bacterium]|nr:mechanosensitive ion channel family protein [Jiangellales bacterium]
MDLRAGSTPSPESTAPSFDDIRIEPATANCYDEGSGNTLCQLVYQVTGSEWLADWSNTLIARPFMILVILVGAFLVRWLLHRAIDRLAGRAAAGRTPGVLARSRVPVSDIGPLSAERRSQRLSTMASLLKSITTGIVFVVALFMVIAELGFNIAPLVASAGIIGVALGFGSQALVKDFLSGLFMIVEDQYGVGDVVDLGEANGVVEAVGLRITRLRAVDGTVWYVRNGEIVRVGNMSYGWSRAVLDVSVAYGEDTGRVRRLLTEVSHELAQDEVWGELILEEPEVWGVEALSVDSVVVRVVLKTRPLEQWKVAREMRERIKRRFDAEGVEIPFPQRTLWIRGEGPGADDERPPRSPDRTDDDEQDLAERRAAALRPDPYKQTSDETTGQIPAVREEPPR